MGGELETHHDKQVRVIIEDKHIDNTGVQMPVLVLLVSVLALRSTMFHLKVLHITKKINFLLHYSVVSLNLVRLTIVSAQIANSERHS